VRSTDFTYAYEKDPTSAQNPIYSFLLSVTQTGYKQIEGGGTLVKSLPPVAFEYSKPTIRPEVHEVAPASLENLPYGLDGANYQWVDLDSEGLAGILTEQAGDPGAANLHDRYLRAIVLNGPWPVTVRLVRVHEDEINDSKDF
jgi:hypothetical protein